MFPIPWNRAFRKKDGTLVNMEDIAGGGGSDLPEHSISDAGKVLGVVNDGELAWIAANSLHMYEVTTNQYAAQRMYVLTTVNEENLNTYEKLKNALSSGIGFVTSGLILGTANKPIFAKRVVTQSSISIYYAMESAASEDIWGSRYLPDTATISSTKIF